MFATWEMNSAESDVPVTATVKKSLQNSRMPMDGFVFEVNRSKIRCETTHINGIMFYVCELLY